MAPRSWQVGDTVGNEYSARPAGYTRPIPGTDWGDPNSAYAQGNTGGAGGGTDWGDPNSAYGQVNTGGAGGGTGIPPQREPGDTRTEPTERAQNTFDDYQKRIATLLARSLDPNFINQLRDADLRRELQLADRYGEIARTRDIQMQNIRSWQAIQQAQINRDALMAASMMNTAFLAHTPNASIVQALQGPMQIAAQAFRGA